MKNRIMAAINVLACGVMVGLYAMYGSPIAAGLAAISALMFFGWLHDDGTNR